MGGACPLVRTSIAAPMLPGVAKFDQLHVVVGVASYCICAVWPDESIGPASVSSVYPAPGVISPSCPCDPTPPKIIESDRGSESSVRLNVLAVLVPVLLCLTGVVSSCPVTAATIHDHLGWLDVVRTVIVPEPGSAPHLAYHIVPRHARVDTIVVPTPVHVPTPVSVVVGVLNVGGVVLSMTVPTHCHTSSKEELGGVIDAVICDDVLVCEVALVSTTGVDRATAG